MTQYDYPVAGGPPTKIPYIVAADAVSRINDAVQPMFTGPEVTAFLAANSQIQLAALSAASDKIDRQKWQGRQLLFTQAREFPRAAYDTSSPSLYGVGFVGPINIGVGETIWDWDWNANQPVVPDSVIQATILEAGSIILGTRADRTNAIHDGVKSAKTASVSEDYDAMQAGARTQLCAAAWKLLDRYELTSGRIL